LLYLSVRPPVWKNWTSIGGFSWYLIFNYYEKTYRDN
jgi:hypothetical protein